MNPSVEKVLAELKIEPKSFKPLSEKSAVLFGTVAGGEPAVKAWQTLRATYGDHGYWPILRGDMTELSDDLDDADEPIDVQATLREVSTAPLTEQLKAAQERERQRMIEWYRKNDQEPSPFLLNPEQFAEEESAYEDDGFEWPEDAEPRPFQPVVPFDILSRKPLNGCGLALIHTDDPTTVPAHLAFGGWNACPFPGIQVAALRQWRDRYGAVPACMSHDVLELYVERPPQTRDEAMELAREQFAFCEDIVTQGTESVAALAAELWKSRQWYFWWD